MIFSPIKYIAILLVFRVLACCAQASRNIMDASLKTLNFTRMTRSVEMWKQWCCWWWCSGFHFRRHSKCLSARAASRQSRSRWSSRSTGSRCFWSCAGSAVQIRDTWARSAVDCSLVSNISATHTLLFPKLLTTKTTTTTTRGEWLIILSWWLTRFTC